MTERRTRSTRYGARIVRRSDKSSNCVKTDNVLLTTSPDSTKCTLEICNLSRLYPPYSEKEDQKKERLLIPLTKVSVFAKHFDVNSMYWTLFPFESPVDEVQIRISCVASEYPMTDFAIGLVPIAYRFSSEPFVSLCIP